MSYRKFKIILVSQYKTRVKNGTISNLYQTKKKKKIFTVLIKYFIKYGNLEGKIDFSSQFWWSWHTVDLALWHSVSEN